MSIRNISPYLLLALIALPSCVVESNDGEETRGADADTQDESDSDEDGRDGGSKDDDEDSDDSDESQEPDDTEDAGTADDSDESDDSDTTAADDTNDTDAGAQTSHDSDGTEADGGGGADVPDDAETASFFMPTTEPENTVAPRLEMDAQGGVHAVYPAYAGGGAFYSYCAADCGDTDNFDVVFLDTDETVANAMLVLTTDGKPQILLSMFNKAAYATCQDDCTDFGSWKTGDILDYNGEGAIKKEISGEALALDPEGHPHFISHTYRAFLGVGQQEQLTHHHACYEDDCTVAANWTASQIATQTWEESQLEFDAEGNAHLAFVAIVESENEPTTRIAAYGTCIDECDNADNWLTAGIAQAYTDQYEAFDLTSSIALALTKAGNPRIVVLAKSAEGDKNLTYFECDESCTGDGGGWVGVMLSDSAEAQVGLDLALDAQDHPKFVQTLNYNIALAQCDDLPCSDADAEWKMSWVEVSNDIPKDDIILFPNCTVAAWFLHSPSLVLDADGNPYVGYQARDISGGVSNPDPLEQDCVAGTDMTLTRMTQMVL